MKDNHWRSQTDKWSQIDTTVMPRIDTEAATMARQAVTPALAWSDEPVAAEYPTTPTKRVPRAMKVAGIGVGAAAAIATAAIVVFGPAAQSTAVAPPSTATQSVVGAPTTPAAAPTTTAASIAPQARSHQSDNSNNSTHDSSPQPTYTPSNDWPQGQQNGYQWQPRRDFTPRDFRWFLPHFDGSNSNSYDHDSFRGHESFGHHQSDSNHDDNH